MNFDYTLDQLPIVAKKILLGVKQPSILLFYGKMGVGKTTLIKELAAQLGVTDIASSPTFSLVNEYQNSQGDLFYHFDFYRINNAEEALDIGIEEYFDNNTWCFVEWPEKVENLLPLDAVAIRISTNSNGSRSIQIN